MIMCVFMSYLLTMMAHDDKRNSDCLK